MLYPDFEEVAQAGTLSIGANTLSRVSPVEVELLDKEGRLIIDLAVAPEDLMRALMGRGSIPVRFVVLENKTAELERELAEERLDLHMANADCSDHAHRAEKAEGNLERLARLVVKLAADMDLPGVDLTALAVRLMAEARVYLPDEDDD
jgi:hypothetical protein